jgi:hypothetical protein
LNRKAGKIGKQRAGFFPVSPVLLFKPILMADGLLPDSVPSLYQSHLEFRLLGRKAEAEIMTTDHTDYTDRGRFGFFCVRAIGVIRG